MVALIAMHCISVAPAEYLLLFCYCLEIWKLLQNLIYCIIPLLVIIMSPTGKTISWGLRVVKVKTFCYQYLLQRCTMPSTSSTWWKYLSLLSVDGKELCRGQKNSWSSDMTSQILCNVSLEFLFFIFYFFFFEKWSIHFLCPFPTSSTNYGFVECYLIFYLQLESNDHVIHWTDVLRLLSTFSNANNVLRQGSYGSYPAGLTISRLLC